MNKETKELPPTMIIPFVGIPFVEQISHMRCGSYTAEWISKAMGFHIRSANDVLQGPVWHDYLRAILPLTVLKLLKIRGIEGVVINIDAVLSLERKIDWLKRELYLRKKPILLLIKATTLHWIVLAGYDDEKKLFYVYDPNRGKTSLNKDLPIGNIALDYQRLISLWEGRWNFRFTAVLILNEYVRSEEEAESAEVSKKDDEVVSNEPLASQTVPSQMQN